MKNYVTYNFNWLLEDNSAEIHKVLGDLVYASGFDAASVIRSQGMENSNITFYITRPDDVARIAAFDAAMREAVKVFEADGFTWVDNTSNMRQPRIMKNTKGVFFGSGDIVAKVTRQRHKKVKMVYFNQSAGVTFAIEVADWVIVGEENHVNNMTSLLREHFRRKEAVDSDAVINFINAYEGALNTDQVIVFGMCAQGNMAPILTSRPRFELDIDQVNEFLRTRNFMPLGKIEFN